MKCLCYTREKNNKLICLCKVGNPACDRYKSCDKRNIYYDNKAFKGVEECFKQNRYGK